jgi:hypothetical protein
MADAELETYITIAWELIAPKRLLAQRKSSISVRQ